MKSRWQMKFHTKSKLKTHLIIKSSSITHSSVDSDGVDGSNRLFVCFFRFLRCDVTRVNESSFNVGSFVMLNNWKNNKNHRIFERKMGFSEGQITIFSEYLQKIEEEICIEHAMLYFTRLWQLRWDEKKKNFKHNLNWMKCQNAIQKRKLQVILEFRYFIDQILMT